MSKPPKAKKTADADAPAVEAPATAPTPAEESAPVSESAEATANDVAILQRDLAESQARLDAYADNAGARIAQLTAENEALITERDALRFQLAATADDAERLAADFVNLGSNKLFQVTPRFAPGQARSTRLYVVANDVNEAISKAVSGDHVALIDVANVVVAAEPLIF
jgi:hypothetical protein